MGPVAVGVSDVASDAPSLVHGEHVSCIRVGSAFAAVDVGQRLAVGVLHYVFLSCLKALLPDRLHHREYVGIPIAFAGLQNAADVACPDEDRIACPGNRSEFCPCGRVDDRTIFDFELVRHHLGVHGCSPLATLIRASSSSDLEIKEMFGPTLVARSPAGSRTDSQSISIALRREEDA